jgi:hypothetical protein
VHSATGAFAGVGSHENRSTDSKFADPGHGFVDWPIARDRSPVYIVTGDMTSERVAKNSKIESRRFPTRSTDR